VFKRRKPEDTVAEGLEAGRAPFPAIPMPDAPMPNAPMPNAAGGAGQRQAGDNLGVPPYRPVPATTTRSTPIESVTSQEALAMGRAPFPAPPAPPSPFSPPAPRPGTAIPPGPILASGAPGAGPGTGAGMQADSLPAGAASAAIRPKEAVEKRTLVVGRGISVQGTVQDAERLVVEGTVEASMIHATELHVAPGGMFRGEVQVQDAEVAGTIDGTLTAKGSLVIRASGRLLGTAKCRRLQVEDGGQVTGRLEMLSDAMVLDAAAAPAEPIRPAPQLPEAAHAQPETVSAS